MLPSFKLVVKARGTEGIFQLCMGVMCILITSFFLVAHFMFGTEMPPLLVVLHLALLAAGAFLLCRAISSLLKNREWEFRVSRDTLQWIERDQTVETLECEIRVQDIRAFVYERGDGESCARLKIEMEDGTLKRFALVGPPTDDSLLAFINYWRENHSDIPIRNIDGA
jgi:hypothetical protein